MRETPLAVLVVACFVAAACGEPLTAAPDGGLSSTDGRAIDVGADGSQTGILVDYPAPTHCDHGLVLDPSLPEIAMAGGSPLHARLAMRVGRLLGNQLERSPCEPYSSDLKIHIGRAKRTTCADVVIVRTAGRTRASRAPRATSSHVSAQCFGRHARSSSAWVSRSRAVEVRDSSIGGDRRVRGGRVGHGGVEVGIQICVRGARVGELRSVLGGVWEVRVRVEEVFMAEPSSGAEALRSATDHSSSQSVSHLH